MNKAFVFLILLAFASLAHASGAAQAGEEHGIPWYTISMQALNLGLLLAVLFFVTKKQIVEAFVGRQAKFNEQAVKTAAALKAAEQELKDIKDKLSSLEASEQSALRQAQTEAENVRQKLIQEAEGQAKKLKDDTSLIVTAEVAKARNEIRTQIIEKSLAAAQASIQQASASITQKSEKGFLEDLGQVKT